MIRELLRGDRDFQKGLLDNRKKLRGPDPCECGTDVCADIDVDLEGF